MADQFVGSFMAFKGEDEYCPQQDILVEITEIKSDTVELAFDAPIPGKPRCYLSVSLADVIRQAMKDVGE